jgi:D-arabinose 1-dehydrogenase-like Zn-dependent alcohol dehydrogenase
MHTVKAWGAPAAGKQLEPMTIQRRDPGPRDVVIDVKFCGVCHSDIHQARDEWSGAAFPMVPGHEIVGIVTSVGRDVTKLKVGEKAGVGCMVDSCRQCPQCAEGHEQYCAKGMALTYNGTEMDRVTPTYGGYSTELVVDEAFTLRIPDGLDLAGAAPLLCAGITTYSPLRQLRCKAGDRVGVVGLGGLGHMAVKLAASMVLVGAPPGATSIHAFSLIGGGKQLLGSLIGGVAETQEMLDHCAKHGVVSDVEVIPIQRINEAYERVLKSDVRYRFVIDLASLASPPRNEA